MRTPLRRSIAQVLKIARAGGRSLPCLAIGPPTRTAATWAGARRLRSLSVTSFPSTSVLGRQSSRLPTGHMPRAPVLPCLRRSTLSAAPMRGSFCTVCRQMRVSAETSCESFHKTFPRNRYGRDGQEHDDQGQRPVCGK